jgi:hypothetical protein
MFTRFSLRLPSGTSLTLDAANNFRKFVVGQSEHRTVELLTKYTKNIRFVSYEAMSERVPSSNTNGNFTYNIQAFLHVGHA